MNMLKKGPDLKLGNFKAPGFLQDIYYDLRDRHLLPLVVLLLVAVVAVPILIGNGGEFDELPPAATAPPAGASSSNLVVAKATPGLRQYPRRFEGEAARDPFKQQYSETEGAASASSEADPPSEATIESSGTGGGSEPAPSGGGGAAPDEEPNRDRLVYYSWVIDVSVASGTSGENKSQPTVRRSQPQYTSLPSDKVPALTFIGVSKDETRALMLVSDKVTGLFGDGVCVQGTERCQLLALEPGIPITVVYGADSRTYRVELRKIRLVKSGDPSQAPLGKNGKNGKKKGQQGNGRAKGSSVRAPIGPASTEVDLDQLFTGQ